jgi:hypothetical protein
VSRTSETSGSDVTAQAPGMQPRACIHGMASAQWTSREGSVVVDAETVLNAAMAAKICEQRKPPRRRF